MSSLQRGARGSSLVSQALRLSIGGGLVSCKLCGSGSLGSSERSSSSLSICSALLLSISQRITVRCVLLVVSSVQRSLLSQRSGSQSLLLLSGSALHNRQRGSSLLSSGSSGRIQRRGLLGSSVAQRSLLSGGGGLRAGKRLRSSGSLRRKLILQRIALSLGGSSGRGQRAHRCLLRGGQLDSGSLVAGLALGGRASSLSLSGGASRRKIGSGALLGSLAIGGSGSGSLGSSSNKRSALGGSGSRSIRQGLRRSGSGSSQSGSGSVSSLTRLGISGVALSSGGGSKLGALSLSSGGRVR